MNQVSPGVGHNRAPHELCAEKTQAWAAKVGPLLERDIDADNAPLYRDALAEGTQLTKTTETERKAVKQPHLDAAAAVDTDFRPIGEELAATIGKLRSRLTAFAEAEERRRRAEAARAAEEARQLQEEAQRLAEAADGGDPFAQVGKEDAEHDAALATLQADQAAKMATAAPSVGSSAGYRAGSLRTVRKAKVTDAVAMVTYFASHPSVIAEAEKLANSAIRAARGGPIAIPGVEVVEDRTFV